MPKDDYFSNMGLTLMDDGKLAWGLDHGFGRWLPEWVKQVIISVWNPIRCWQHGHDMSIVELAEHGYVSRDNVRCCACCADLTQHVRWVKPAPDSEFEHAGVE